MDYLEQAQLIGINRNLERQRAAIEDAAQQQRAAIEDAAQDQEELLKRQNDAAERRHEEILRVEAARGNVEAIRILEERNAERERARIQVEQFRAQKEIEYREYLRQNELNEAQAKIQAKINEAQDKIGKKRNQSVLSLVVIICSSLWFVVGLAIQSFSSISIAGALIFSAVVVYADADKTLRKLPKTDQPNIDQPKQLLPEGKKANIAKQDAASFAVSVVDVILVIITIPLVVVSFSRHNLLIGSIGIGVILVSSVCFIALNPWRKSKNK